MTVSRRDLIRASAVAGATAVAGCSSTLGGGSNGSADAGRNWLYEPGTVADVDHYLALRYAPARIAERSGNFDDGVYDAMRAFGGSARDLVGFEFASTDAQLAFGKNAVLEADFEAEDVVSRLESEDFASEESYGEFDVYVGSDDDAAVGIGSDAVVVARSTGVFGSADDAERILAAIVDVHAGDAESYVEDSADFETLVDAAAEGDVQSVRTHPETDETDTDEGEFRGEVARGIDSTLVDDASVETTFVRAFNEESDVDEGDVEDWVARSETFDDFEAVDVSTDGRVVEVTGTEAIGAYDFYVGSA
jgi:hypothetical protein